MIYTLFIFVWIVFVTILFGVGVILVSLFDPSGNWPHRVARAWGGSILFASRIKVTVRGLENIDPAKPYIYMANHQSNFDIPVLLAYLPVQFRWLAKAELFRIPLFGLAMRRVGYISIDRANRKSAFDSLAKAAQTIRDGASVLIFPEGTRSRDGRIGPFKKGGFVMAVEAGVPVVPVVVHGTRAIMPRQKLSIRPGRVVIDIKPAVPAAAYTRATKDVLLNDIREVIVETFASCKEVASC